jgi:hypothetical protein
MKKVIKPSKQPTKKRNQRSPRTAKLTIAISKIAAQLVKDHPKLIKGGGSLGITELLFSKILIKGGKLNDAAREKIIKFLNDIAPQVNKLKNDLITKLLEYLATKESTDTDEDICKNIIDINKEFDKGLYDYDIKDDIQDQIGKLSEEIKEYIAILDIVKKFYILSRLKDDETGAFASTKNKINENKFEPLTGEILKALKENKDLKAILEEYLKNKKRDNGNGAPEVKEEEESSQTLIDILNRLKKEIDNYNILFTLSNNLIIKDDKITFKNRIIILSDDQQNKLQDLNLLYGLFYTNIFKEFYKISNKYISDDSDDITLYKITEGNRSDIAQDLDTLLKLNEDFKQIYNIRKDDIINYLDIIDPGRHNRPGSMEVDSSLTDYNFKPKALDAGWGEGPGNPHAIPSTGGNPAKYKSTGQVVYIMYQNKKYKRVIYVKDKRNTRYCKINKEYILLSKLKVIQ